MAEEFSYYEPQPTNPHGFRVEAHCRADVKRGHNIRDPQYVENRKNVDLQLPHTIIKDMGPLPEAFETIFGSAIEEYNSTQKRSDRKKTVKEYLSNFLQTREQTEDKQKATGKDRGKAFQQAQYEMMLQIGNRDNFPDRELASQILTDFVTKVFPEKWPGVRITGAYLHNDEFSIDEKTGQRIRSPSQIHLDFIYTAERLTEEEQKGFKQYKAEEKQRLKAEAAERGEQFDEDAWKKINWQQECVERYGKSLVSGLPLQCSMSACLAQMGYFTAKGKGTAQTQWEEAVRFELQDFAESYGLKIDRTLGPKHKHMTTDEWQLHQDNEKDKSEISETREALNKEIDKFNENVKPINEKYDRAVEAKAIAEEKEKNAKNFLAESKKLNLITNTELLKTQSNLSEIGIREDKVSLREQAATLWELDLAEKREKYAIEWDDIQEIQRNVNDEREIYEAYWDALETGYYDYNEIKNANSMKDLDIARLNGELKWHKYPSDECEAYMLERQWWEEEFGELKNFHGCKARYVQSHNIDDRNSMIKSFFDGVLSIVDMFYQMCKKWTPTYLRNLARNMEYEGCSNYADYRKRSRSSGWER